MLEWTGPRARLRQMPFLLPFPSQPFLHRPDFSTRLAACITSRSRLSHGNRSCRLRGNGCCRFQCTRSRLFLRGCWLGDVALVSSAPRRRYLRFTSPAVDVLSMFDFRRGLMLIMREKCVVKGFTYQVNCVAYQYSKVGLCYYSIFEEMEIFNFYRP